MLIDDNRRTATYRRHKAKPRPPLCEGFTRPNSTHCLNVATQKISYDSMGEIFEKQLCDVCTGRILQPGVGWDKM